MHDPRTRLVPSFAWVGLVALLLTACSATTRSTPGAPASITGADAERAVAVAAHCIEGAPWLGTHLGFGLAVRSATVHRPVNAGALVLVRIPEGVYTGRLPPPRPAEALWLEVDPDAKTCREVPAP